MKCICTARMVVALLSLAAVLLVGAGCDTLDRLGKADGAGQASAKADSIKIRHVVVERAPFYLRFPRDGSIPFIYLTRGAVLEWIKLKDGLSKVKLADGSSGWVPTAALGETVGGTEQDLQAVDASPGKKAGQGSGSEAVKFDGTAPLRPFNRTTGVW